MPPVFSAVITNYNYERYLADAVQSVLCQTFAVREIVVVDDGSTDGSRDLLEAMERTHPQLKLVRQANGGQLAAFQSGARAATGDYIALLDADDEWLPAHIEGVAGLLGRHPELDFIFTNMHYGEAREGLVFADRLAVII